MTRFDLEWRGGAAEKYFRRIRPGVEEMPWGTLDVSHMPLQLVERARVSWTEAAYNEYCTAAAFAQLVSALLAARAPVDLVAMASDFLADELLHVELASRLAMELGGGAPYDVDFARLVPPPSRPNLSPLALATELVVRFCCVGEAFSVHMLAGSLRSATHPLPRAVLRRIVHDEAPHGQFGWQYLDWAADQLDDAERARLSQVAVAELQIFGNIYRRLQSRVTNGITSEGFRIEDVRILGWMESSEYAMLARDAVVTSVVRPLDRYGIVLPAEEVRRLIEHGQCEPAQSQRRV
ncbi:MAG: hypothetical protein NVS3B20_26510 [Polyangiales bacterium]